MRNTKKNINKVLKSAMAALPAALPFIMRSRQRTSITAYVLGGVGFAVAGGIAALMFFSPRTRTRALDVAKGTYGKVNEKISHLRPHSHEAGAEMPLSNGFSGSSDYSRTTSGPSGV